MVCFVFTECARNKKRSKFGMCPATVHVGLKMNLLMNPAL